MTKKQNRNYFLKKNLDFLVKNFHTKNHILRSSVANYFALNYRTLVGSKAHQSALNSLKADLALTKLDSR